MAAEYNSVIMQGLSPALWLGAMTPEEDADSFHDAVELSLIHISEPTRPY